MWRNVSGTIRCHGRNAAFSMSQNHCQWVKGNNKVCNVPCKGDKHYCYVHEPLAMVGYTRPSRETLDSAADAQQDKTGTQRSRDRVEELRKQWGVELEQDFQADKSKGKRKGKVIKPSDFPNYFDGVWYNSIEDYASMHMDFEMPGTDQMLDTYKRVRENITPTLDWKKYNPDPKPKKDHRTEYGFEKEHYVLKDSIAHMRYVVYRAADGLYYPVFMSLWGKGEQEQKVQLKEMLAELTVVTLPKVVPHVVERDGKKIGQFHTVQGYTRYYGAEDRFTMGGESLTRVKERMRKAADPNWIPPNLRKMAVEATYDPKVWDYIPKQEHARLKKWMADGCPGWYSKMPKGYKSKSYSSGKGHFTGLPTGYSGGGQTTLFSSALDKHGASYASTEWSQDATWDGDIGMWVTRRKRKQ